jgi:ribosomal protein S27E
MSQFYFVDCPVCKTEHVFYSPYREKWVCSKCGKILYDYKEEKKEKQIE